MRKIFTSLCLALAACLTASAQSGAYQIPNSDFNNWAADNEPGNGWNSFPSATGSMSGMGIGSSPKPSKDTGRSGAANDYSCKLFSNSIWGVKANGNLTTGRINMGSMKPADASNHNFTDRSASSHGLRFAGRPDAVEFYAKFNSGGSPCGRGQFILHGDVDYKDPEDASQASYKVGIASVEVPASADWTYFSGEFTYLAEQPATQYMLASFTTNPTPGGSKGDELWIDDVKLIYYHSLTALSYQGATINFNENTLSYDLSSVSYEESKLSYTKKGAGAVVEKSFDANSNVLTINVKGSDYAENAQSITTYRIQFGDGVTPPVVEPDTELPLGEKVYSLSEIAANKTYVLFNEAYNAYLIYNGAHSTTNVWTAEMISGDADHQLKSETYAEALNISDAGSSWMFIRDTESASVKLYNVGAQKYLVTPGYSDVKDETMPCTFSAEASTLQLVELGNGRFAFSSTGNENDYVCASPQLDFPVATWKNSDTGAAWELYENPNVEADETLVPREELPLGAKVTSFDDIDMTKTYVLYNSTFTAYAIYNGTHSTSQIWTAGMIGGDASHQLSNQSYAEPVDLLDAGSSWMVMKANGNTYLYNVGAKMYLNTPSHGGESKPCTFSSYPVAIQVVAVANGNFAFSSTGDEKDFMCAAPQMEFPISIWTSDDSGAAWGLYENPNVEADLDLLDSITSIESVSTTTNAPAGIYTVSGMKLNTTDTTQLPAGLYIVNGKKMLIGK